MTTTILSILLIAFIGISAYLYVRNIRSETGNMIKDYFDKPTSILYGWRDLDKLWTPTKSMKAELQDQFINFFDRIFTVLVGNQKTLPEMLEILNHLRKSEPVKLPQELVTLLMNKIIAKNLDTVIKATHDYLDKATYRDLLVVCDYCKTGDEQARFEKPQMWQPVIYSLYNYQYPSTGEQSLDLRTVLNSFKPKLQQLTSVEVENALKNPETKTQTLTELLQRSWMSKEDRESINTELSRRLMALEEEIPDMDAINDKPAQIKALKRIVTGNEKAETGGNKLELVTREAEEELNEKVA